MNPTASLFASRADKITSTIIGIYAQTSQRRQRPDLPAYRLLTVCHAELVDAALAEYTAPA
jgi:hypothetical protein